MEGMPDMPKMPDMPNMPKIPGMGGEPTQYTIDFKAPDTLKVELKEAAVDPAGGAGGGMGGGRGGMMGGEMMKKAKILPIRMGVLGSLGVIGPTSDSEYDADVETEAGQKVLVITNYESNVKSGVMRMYLNETGLPSRGTMKVEGTGGGGGRGGMGGMQVEMTWEWGKDGERYLLQKMGMKMPMMQKPMEIVNAYADVGGYKLLVGWSSSMRIMQMEIVTTTRYTNLEVNGKAVDVPAPAASEATGPAKMPAPPKKKGDKAGKGGEEGGEEGDEDDDEGDEKDER